MKRTLAAILLSLTFTSTATAEDKPYLSLETAPIVVVGMGQSNLAREGKAGIGRSFVRKLRKEHPNRKVIYIQVAKGGQPVSEFMPGTKMFRQMRSKTKGLPPADYMIIQQGEADHSRSHKYWSGSWNKIIGGLRGKRVIDRKTTILVGEMAYGGKDHQNKAIRMIKDAVRVRSKGLPTSDRLHFSRKGARILGKRYFNKAMRATK